MEDIKTVKSAKYWINENGTERKASYKEFRYWYNNFCGSVMDGRNGNILDKGKISIKNVEIIYNGFGFAIAGRVLWKNFAI